MKITRRKLLQASVPVGAAIAIGAGVAACRSRSIRVGVLHSTTGTMASSEMPVVDATRLGLDEINQRGGVLGRTVVPIVADGASTPAEFAAQAERLIKRENVSVIFGCWTSASRKAVVPVVEKLGNLLVYPVQYEGLEASPNVIYTGAAPNQQIMPAVAWATSKLGKRLYLVGSDYVFPRTAHAIVKDQLRSMGLEPAGESYLLLGTKDVKATVADIVERAPDVIINSINGDTNVAFFEALRAAGVTPSKIPTVSFSIAEPELQTFKGASIEGDYAAWNYFQSIATDQNRGYLSRFRARYGASRVTSDPMEAAWIGTQLWAQACTDADSAEPGAARAAMLNQSIAAPEGVVAIDPETGHSWKSVRVGRVRSDGQFDVVWDGGRPSRPVPFPIYRSRAEWARFLTDLQKSYGGEWAPPTTG